MKKRAEEMKKMEGVVDGGWEKYQSFFDIIFATEFKWID
jgi:hypothetical protein